MNSTIVRKAKLEDLPFVINLVKELALFEKEPEAVTASLTDYQKAFSNNKIMIQLAEIQGQVVGIIIMYEAFSTWKGPILYLEDFYVKREFRNLGIGKMLFESYLKLGQAGGYSKLKWQVLDWNKDAINFYKRYNAMIEKNWWNGVIELQP